MSERDGISYQHKIGPDGRDHVTTIVVTTIVESDAPINEHEPPGERPSQASREPEPLSAERLAIIRQYARYDYLNCDEEDDALWAIKSLLIEVDRMRAALAARDEIVARSREMINALDSAYKRGKLSLSALRALNDPAARLRTALLRAASTSTEAAEPDSGGSA